MSRGVKKTLYGLLYLALLIFIAGLLFRILTAPDPTCSDGVRNQGETGVDCGGPCAQCAALNLAPLRVSYPVNFFRAAGALAAFARVANPNRDFSANFSYRFVFYDAREETLGSLSGSDTARAGGEAYIFRSGALEFPREVARADVEIGKMDWVRAELAPPPSVSLAPDVATIIENGAVKVSGVAKNGSPFDAAEVKIIALLFDRERRELFASQTYLVLEEFEERQFSVLFPADARLAENVDTGATEVFISAR